ncbi:hypothetical protein BP5796_03147 [Coleophoma crateriformis]|uniref:Glycoside hydrolase family 76 protein n=1 Tax=Coleophoma crateriformis TaxID=565419 RepID=A0A3D8SMA2_9HELO|nr:hypothetical protein BP5796_03147 [Coleophoma crateriformis]
MRFLVLVLLSLQGAWSAQAFVEPSVRPSPHARAAFIALQTWYNKSSGIWDSTGWWNAANCLTTVGNLAAIDPLVKLITKEVFSNTFVQGQRYQLQMTKSIRNFTIETCYGDTCAGSPPSSLTKGFLNDYYDDEGWWALAWIQAYDITQEPQYLAVAIGIFEDMRRGSSPCGGIWWDKARTYVNAIPNELFLSVAAHLANRSTHKATREYYRKIAIAQWKWFQASGMINAEHLVNDGLTADCRNNHGAIWSYNQGVVLGGLVELSIATQERKYLKAAKRTAEAAIEALSDSDGILHEACEPDCGADGSQFKGIFARNLQKLHQVEPKWLFAEFLARNAASIWKYDRNGRDQMGLVWSGPSPGSVNASTHSSALDALVAAVVAKRVKDPRSDGMVFFDASEL